MQEIDKFKHDMDAALRRAGSASAEQRLAAAGRCFEDSFRALPSETVAALRSSFEGRFRADEEKATAWLGGMASILLQDYDGTAFEAADWADLKEAADVGADEMDLDLLTYVMGLVLDHGAL